MATQNYLLNQPFNTLSIDELLAQDGNAWTWEGRTLVGYVSADNYDNIIPVGSEFVHGEQTGDLKGVWELNKLQLSVFIENAGPDSYVEISAATHKRLTDKDVVASQLSYYINKREYSSRPLTDEEQITEMTAYNGDIIDFWDGSKLTCNIHVGDNHIISCVYWDDLIYTNNYTLSSHFDSSKTTYYGIQDEGVISGGVVCNKTLSVVLLEGGIMTYSNNKFVLNPNHSPLNN